LNHYTAADIDNRLTMRIHSRNVLLPLAIALLIAGGAPGAFAKSPAKAGAAKANHRSESRVAAGGLSLDAVVAQMEKRYNARVVRAETRHDNGRTIYVLRLLNADGKVWTVQIDADSGAVL
jgi:uncharacterized iron-regulated membrane protein